MLLFQPKTAEKKKKTPTKKAPAKPKAKKASPSS